MTGHVTGQRGGDVCSDCARGDVCGDVTGQEAVSGIVAHHPWGRAVS